MSVLKEEALQEFHFQHNCFPTYIYIYIYIYILYPLNVGAAAMVGSFHDCRGALAVQRTFHGLLRLTVCLLLLSAVGIESVRCTRLVPTLEETAHQALTADDTLSLSRVDSRWRAELGQPSIWLLGCKLVQGVRAVGSRVGVTK